jgi:hypothetical protein
MGEGRTPDQWANSQLQVFAHENFQNFYKMAEKIPVSKPEQIISLIKPSRQVF